MSIDSAPIEERQELPGEKEREAAFKRGHRPKNIDAYHEERVARIMKGELVWLVPNFDADFGRVYELYNNGRYVGYLDEEYGIDVIGYGSSAENPDQVENIPGSFMQVVDWLEDLAKVKPVS